jgi:2,4-dienoyl-CoA reductase-like NADH-dependent reductase (Old Yellow Enzyme family)/thioredoxin reductase
MSTLKYPHLFEPIEIGGTLFRNRLFSSPQGFYNLATDLCPGDDMVAFFEAKARGGFASVCVGDCMVDFTRGRHYDWLIPLDNPKLMPGLAKLTSAVSRQGSVISAELSHAGMYALASHLAGAPLYGPVEMEGKYGHVHEMPEEMILETVESFGKAAAFAKRVGFGMVTIHGGHGWLHAQFLSPYINTRKDRWGGSFENRMRFSLAVVESIRRHCGKNFPIEFRMSGSECFEGGYDLDEGIAIAKALDGKVDIIHVSAGNHEIPDSSIITHPSMFKEDGVNLYLAAEIKKHVKTPVGTVGGFTDPAHMEEVIASGKADIINLGRQSLADQDLPNKARLGRDEDINKCLRCCACFSGVGDRRIFYCATNPVTGHEYEDKYLPPAARRKRVLVAGGGVAGMQAALTAAQRGHDVILCEKADKLGGVLRCEENVPFKKKLAGYIEYQIRNIGKAAVDVRLGTPVTPELVEELRPDVVIAAVGARPIVPNIPGIDGKNVLGAEEAYMSPDKVGKVLTIIGGGLVGVELAIFMAQEGRKVTIIEAEKELSLGNPSPHFGALQNKISELDIRVLTSAKVERITESGVAVQTGEGAQEITSDTVVYAVGQKPLREDVMALSRFSREFYAIGDCVAPKNILEATQAAWTIARTIGRF